MTFEILPWMVARGGCATFPGLHSLKTRELGRVSMFQGTDLPFHYRPPPDNGNVGTGQAAGFQGTCRHNDSPFVGGHVGRRGAILLVHVAVIVHGVGFTSAHQLVAFADTAVHRRLPGARGDKDKKSSLWGHLTPASAGLASPLDTHGRVMTVMMSSYCYLP